MKVSISLSADELAALDDFAHATGLPSRSAAVQVAIRQLRQRDLERDYAHAWDEWAESGAQQAWEPTVDDGLR